MLPVGAPRVLAERLDLAADACGARDAFVSRHQLDLERLRKRHVGGVVRGEVVSQLPAARKQGLVCGFASPMAAGDRAKGPPLSGRAFRFG